MCARRPHGGLARRGHHRMRTHGGAGNGHSLLPEGAANPNIGPFTPELGYDYGLTGKGGKVNRFLSSVKSECDGECSTATRAATTGLRCRLAVKRRCQVSVDSLSSERPGWARGVWSSPTGPSAVAEKAWAGGAVGRGAGTAGPISGPLGADARWGPTSDRGAAVSFPYALKTLKLPAFLRAKVPFTCAPRKRYENGGSNGIPKGGRSVVRLKYRVPTVCR